MNILLIDNYDSFTFNLKHLVIECDESINLVVIRNDEGVLKHLSENKYDGVIIGPGPGNPDDEEYFGENRKVILDYGVNGLPVLGVCLGFQGIFSAFGGKLKVSNVPVHGKVSELEILSPGVLLAGINNHEKVMRYHSIIADPDTVPDCLLVTSTASRDEGSYHVNGLEIMTIEHKSAPIFGMQYHPESFATESGLEMLNNFIQVCGNA